MSFQTTCTVIYFSKSYISISQWMQIIWAVHTLMKILWKDFFVFDSNIVDRLYIQDAFWCVLYYFDRRQDTHNFSRWDRNYSKATPEIILANHAKFAGRLLPKINCFCKFQVPKMLTVVCSLHYISLKTCLINFCNSNYALMIVMLHQLWILLA